MRSSTAADLHYALGAPMSVHYIQQVFHSLVVDSISMTYPIPCEANPFKDGM
uniref:Uncharacterized protein n=1 Tax=Romanomermis culicivorax TaxID=13658 RepID=A0A915K5K0_ROMCU